MLLFAEGFDGYNTWEQLVSSLDAVERNAVYSQSLGRFGGGCLISTTLSEGDTYLLKTNPSANKIRVAFWMRCNISSPTTTGNRPVLLLKNAANDRFVRMIINATPRLTLSKFDDTATPTVAITSTFNPNDDAWHHIEFEISADLTAGVCRLWIDGVADAGNISSGDTSDAASGDVTTFDRIQVCGCNSNTGGANFVKIDDLIVWDDVGTLFTGHLSDMHKMVETIPTSDGSSSQFTPSAGANYQCVDEAQLNTSDYVESVTPGHIDYYAMSGLGHTPVAVLAVIVESFVKNNDIDDRTFRNKLKSSSAIGNGATVLLKSGYKRVQDFYLADPNTSAAWVVGHAQVVSWGFEVVA